MLRERIAEARVCNLFAVVKGSLHVARKNSGYEAFVSDALVHARASMRKAVDVIRGQLPEERQMQWLPTVACLCRELRDFRAKGLEEVRRAAS